MTLLAAIAGLVSLVVGWLVTTRVLALARRTRALPERLLALGFGGLFCVGYPLAAASRTPGMAATSDGALLFAIAMLGIFGGVVALSVFPAVVFRPGQRWASTLSGLLCLTGGAAAIGSATCVLGGRSAAEIVSRIQPWATLLMATLAGCFLWHCLESSLYYRRMRRRRALGLVSAETTHRFLLWAIASGWSLVPALAVGGLRASGVAILSPLPMAIIALSSLATSLFWWLAFFMPKSYRRIVLGRASLATPATPVATPADVPPAD